MWETNPSFQKLYGICLQHSHRNRMWYQLNKRCLKLEILSRFRSHVKRQTPRFQNMDFNAAAAFGLSKREFECHASFLLSKHESTSSTNLHGGRYRRPHYPSLHLNYVQRRWAGTKLLTKRSGSKRIIKQQAYVFVERTAACVRN